MLSATSAVTALTARNRFRGRQIRGGSRSSAAAVALAANAAPLPRRFDPAWAHPVALQAVLIASAATTGSGLITLLAVIWPPGSAH